MPTLRDRLPADLRDAPSGPDFDALPFTPLYLTDDEFAAEIANRTVHGVMHLGWVPDGTGGFRGQMAVLVKPNGLLGSAYMAAITPFRHLIVYPAMMREIGRGWRAPEGSDDTTRSNGRPRSFAVSATSHQLSDRRHQLFVSDRPASRQCARGRPAGRAPPCPGRPAPPRSG